MRGSYGKGFLAPSLFQLFFADNSDRDAGWHQ